MDEAAKESNPPRLDHPLEADRVALGHVGALDDDAVSVLEVLLGGGRPTPRPNEVPKPGTVGLCHMRAWCSVWIAPSAVNSFLIR